MCSCWCEVDKVATTQFKKIGTVFAVDVLLLQCFAKKKNPSLLKKKVLLFFTHEGDLTCTE